MASIKTGFSFYQTDTNRYQDPRIRRLKRAHSCEGIAVYDYILCEVYRDKGCYMEWGEDFQFDISEYFGISEEKCRIILEYCVEIGLFDKSVFEKNGCLTSRSIQERFVEMSRRSKRSNTIIPEDVRIIPEECAVTTEESKNTPDSSGSLPYSIVKYSKEKNNKENYLSIEEKDSEKNEREKILKIFLFEKMLQNPVVEFERFWNHYEAQGWKTARGIPITNREAKARKWDVGEAKKIDKDSSEAWKRLYDATKGIPGRELMVEGFSRLEVGDQAVTLFCNQALATFLRNCYDEAVKPAFHEIFGSRRFQYRLSKK